MKENKHGYRHILAILLSVMLFVSSLGLVVSEEVAAAPTDQEENTGEIILNEEELTYSNLEYVLSSTSVPMSEILTTLELSGEVTAVESSDGSLFSASNESGVWIVTVHQAFSSTEWMKVTIDDVVYEITVTYGGTVTSRAEQQYSITVADGITGGTVTADKSQAAAGETVILTVTPDTEYEPKTLTYTPADTEEPVTVSLPSEPDAGTGSYTAAFTMPAADVTVNATYNSTAPSAWSQLVTAFRAGGEVTLTQDVVALEGDGQLVVPSGKTVTLDLNGHTLGPSNNNRVITIDGGTLILTGDGTITGGNRCEYGIFADCDSTFTMNGGTITGVNRDGVYVNTYTVFTMNGGAIRNSFDYGIDIENGSFTMNGGEITGSGNCGLYIYQSDFTMNGGKISDSNCYDVYFDSNNFYLNGGTISGTVYLTNHTKIIIDSQLDPDDCYSIDMQTPGEFTSGLNGRGDLSNFRSDDYNYTVALNEQGEAMLVQSGTVAPYVERSWDGEKVVSKATTRNNGQWQPFPDNANITSGWYYLDRDVTKNGRIVSITGDVNLILGDGKTLDVKGLYVPEGSTLTIYGQTAGTGRIYSHPSGGAAIGGYSEHDNGNIVIKGGTIEAKGYDHCAGIGSNDGHTGGSITIYGGTITADGGSDGAGIGGGRSRPGGNITIYGGDITAKGGGNNGAGIGGGKNGDGGTIIIYGGDITANGPTDSDCNENGAGIGGGNTAAGGNITINGGTITTYSRDGAGIGGGDDGDGGDITINGGTINSNKVNQGQGARIGGGCDAAPGTIIINDGTITTVSGYGAGIGGGKRNESGGSVTINGGVINAIGDYGIGSGDGGSDVSITMGYTDATEDTISVTSVKYGGTVTLNDDFTQKDTDIILGKGAYTDTSQMAGVTLVAYVRPEISYVDLTGEPQSERCTPVSANTTAWDNNWYAITKNVDITSEITVNGDVNLILVDGFKLTSKNIKVSAGSSLTIWGQSGGSGEIVATADHDTKAGIGGGRDGGGVTINISGGVITATSGRIGMGYGYGRSDLPCTINLSWTEESKETMSVTATSYYSPVNLKNAFKDKNDSTVFPAEDSVLSRLNGRMLIPCEIEEQSPVVIIKTANVEFSGKIRLNFSFGFPESVLADEGAYVTFEKAGTTAKKLVSEGTAEGDAVSFIIPVPAPEFADDIIVKVFDGGDSQLTLKSEKGTDYTADGFIYSVKTYAQNKSESGKTEEMRALAKALFDYDTAAQIYFQYGDYDGLSVDGAVSAVTEDDLAPYALTVTGTKPQGVTSAGIMVEFDTDNTLRITFKTDGSKPIGSYTFLLDGTEKKASKKGKDAYLQIKNIAAPNLDTMHTFSVTDGTDTYTVTACALSYAYTSVKNGDSNRQNLGKALYLYNQAANAYFGGL